jgi:hypothetical protein
MSGMAMVDAKVPNFQVPVFGGPHDGLVVPISKEGLFVGNRVVLPGSVDYILHQRHQRWQMTYVPLLARDDDPEHIEVASPYPCVSPEGHDFGPWFDTPGGAWGRGCRHEGCDGFQGTTTDPHEDA